MPYTTGTASVAVNGTAVTGQGTSWASTVRAGDYFWCKGNPVRVQSVNSNTSLTLAFPWPGAAQAAQPYEIQNTPDAIRLADASLAILDLLSTGNLSSEASLVGSADKISYFTGAGQKALADFRDFGRTLAGTANLSAAYQALGFGAGTASVTLPTGSAASPGITFQNNANMGFFRAAANAIGVATAGTEVARFLDTAVGIGKTATQTGSINTSGIVLRNDGLLAAERDSNNVMSLNRFGASPEGQLVQMRSGGSVVGAINVTASATAYATTSDGRLKGDRKPLAETLDVIETVRAMKVFDFAWLDWDGKPTGQRGRGFIAQDLAKVAPDMVVRGEGRRGTESFQPWGVDQSKATPYLVAAIQTLADRLDALERAA